MCSICRAVTQGDLLNNLGGDNARVRCSAHRRQDAFAKRANEK